jgi:hypothetical protein
VQLTGDLTDSFSAVAGGKDGRAFLLNRDKNCAFHAVSAGILHRLGTRDGLPDNGGVIPVLSRRNSQLQIFGLSHAAGNGKNSRSATSVASAPDAIACPSNTTALAAAGGVQAAEHETVRFC